MGSVRIKRQTAPSTPGSTYTELYVDTADGHLKTKDDTGTVVDYYQTVSSADAVIIVDVACDSTVAVGDAVKIVSGTAYKAQADSVSNSGVLGVVNSKSSSVLCSILTEGKTTTIYAGLDDTKDYFLSAATAGALTVTPPTGSGEVLLKIGRPLSATEMVISIGNKRVRA